MSPKGRPKQKPKPTMMGYYYRMGYYSRHPHSPCAMIHPPRNLPKGKYPIPIHSPDTPVM